MGLGIVAAPTVDLPAGCTIVCGEIDTWIWWPELETLIENPKDGKWAALFGPISLLSVCGSEPAPPCAAAVMRTLLSGARWNPALTLLRGARWNPALAAMLRAAPTRTRSSST